MGSKAPPREKVTVRIASDSPCSRRFDSYPPATLPEVLPLSGPGCKARALAHFRSFVRQEANASKHAATNQNGVKNKWCPLSTSSVMYASDHHQRCRVQLRLTSTRIPLHLLLSSRRTTAMYDNIYARNRFDSSAQNCFEVICPHKGSGSWQRSRVDAPFQRLPHNFVWYANCLTDSM